jgi:hypothetical protein
VGKLWPVFQTEVFLSFVKVVLGRCCTAASPFELPLAAKLLYIDVWGDRTVLHLIGVKKGGAFTTLGVQVVLPPDS